MRVPGPLTPMPPCLEALEGGCKAPVCDPRNQLADLKLLHPGEVPEKLQGGRSSVPATPVGRAPMHRELVGLPGRTQRYVHQLAPDGNNEGAVALRKFTGTTEAGMRVSPWNM